MQAKWIKLDLIEATVTTHRVESSSRRELNVVNILHIHCILTIAANSSVTCQRK